jgi:hypothetical protein
MRTHKEHGEGTKNEPSPKRRKKIGLPECMLSHLNDNVKIIFLNLFVIIFGMA